MFAGGSGVIGIFAESMGPTIIHFQFVANVADVDMVWCQDRPCSGRHTRRWGHNVRVVCTMVASRLRGKFADAFLVFKVKKSLKVG
jgi:hypothetical protein